MLLYWNPALLPGSLVMPVPTFILTLLFFIGRVIHQTGYVNGYGSHGAGFGLSVLATITLGGIIFWSALACLGALKAWE